MSRGSSFLVWFLIGAAGCFGVLSLLTVGGLVLPVTLLAAAFVAWRLGVSAQAWGALSGAGVVVAYVAWLNRHGPGTYCEPIGDGGTRCLQEWSPWPFLAVAVALVVVGVVLARRGARTAAPS